MEEQKKTSTPSTSSGGGGKGDVEIEADDNQQLSPAAQAAIVEVDLQKKMEKARLNEDLVFSNDLITDKLWPHLNFADLKATREVSRDFYDKITSFGGFKNSAVLQVTKESVEVADLFDKDASMTRTWTGIQIEVDLPLDVLDKIRHILEHVQFISLVISDSESADIRNENYAKFIAGVLSSTPKLTALQIDVRLLENDFSQVWSCHVIRHHLKNLETLELPLLDLQGNATEEDCRTNGTYRRAKDTHVLVPEDYAKNLEQLATALVETAVPCRLKRLWIPKTAFYVTSNWENPRPEVGPFTRTVLDLLRSHRESLVEVSIPNVWRASDDVRSVILPQLKSLTTSVSSAETFNFETFLTNHPKLEELELHVNDDDDDHELLKAIKRRCSAAGAYLKKVHSTTEQFFWTSQGTNVLLDWSFLEEMKALEDFQVEMSFEFMSESEIWEHALGMGPRILECLPMNQLEKLSLNGIHFEGSFWRVSPEEGEDVLSKEVPLATKLDLLRKFKNLKRLSFRHSPNAVNDDVIQFIFREMTCLDELEVSHCPHLTDFGMSGNGAEQEERVSIQRLEELKVLSIRACPSVTPEGLLSVLALPYLQHLDYYTASPVPKSFIWGIAAQNPSLETISVNQGDSETDKEEAWSAKEKKDFFDKHPRIKALVNLEVLGLDEEYAPNAYYY